MHYLWWIVIADVVVIIMTFALPWLLEEYFPWHSLWQQRKGKPTVVTK